MIQKPKRYKEIENPKPKRSKRVKFPKIGEK